LSATLAGNGIYGEIVCSSADSVSDRVVPRKNTAHIFTSTDMGMANVGLESADAYTEARLLWCVLFRDLLVPILTDNTRSPAPHSILPWGHGAYLIQVHRVD